MIDKVIVYARIVVCALRSDEGERRGVERGAKRRMRAARLLGLRCSECDACIRSGSEEGGKRDAATGGVELNSTASGAEGRKDAGGMFGMQARVWANKIAVGWG